MGIGYNIVVNCRISTCQAWYQDREEREGGMERRKDRDMGRLGELWERIERRRRRTRHDLSLLWQNTQDKNNLEEKGCLLPHSSKVQSVRARKLWQHESEATDHMARIVWSTEYEQWCSTRVLFLIKSRTLVHETVAKSEGMFSHLNFPSRKLFKHKLRGLSPWWL